MDSRKLKTDSITSTFTLNLIRKTCGDQGDKAMFGFDPMEIGNKSLRSGAAMSLFLMIHSSLLEVNTSSRLVSLLVYL
jgi:hypothetical protein